MSQVSGGRLCLALILSRLVEVDRIVQILYSSSSRSPSHLNQGRYLQWHYDP